MITDATTGITVTSPQAISPAVNQQFRFAEQPLTLKIKNAVQTGTSPATYVFEVASDENFATLVYSKDGIPEGGNGQTEHQLPVLAGPLAKNYVWRARVKIGNVVGPNSTGRAFGVGAQVVIGAPALVAPGAGATLGDKGLLTVSNASVTGPAGQIAYRFEVSDTSDFRSLAFVSTVGQSANQTSTSMTARLVTNGTYFWRVQASDPSTAVTGPYSSIGNFKYVPFDMASATIVNSPPDLGRWPETAKITSVEFTGGAFLVDFDRRTGSNRWPDVTPPGWSGALQYTLGLCGNISGQWNCSAVVQFWFGRSLADSAPPHLVGVEWFYDPIRWPGMAGYQPRDGETVGLFVGSGNLRDGGAFTQASCPRICERSNVAFVQWGTSASF
jgi:hypothetical protein